MMLMIGDHNSSVIHYWAGRYPGQIGRLIGPKSYCNHKIKPWLPWAMDNDAFQSWTNEVAWDAKSWKQMLAKASKLKHKPQWALAPDVVANPNATLANWLVYAPQIRAAGITPAFAVQDGMMPFNVPADADVIFVGGTTEWKWRNVAYFCSAFPRVHVGRVNTIDRCFLCQDLGAESVDGTGWFRDGTGDWRFEQLERFLDQKREPAFAFS